jgi:predicted small lipoprotein YifL
MPRAGAGTVILGFVTIAIHGFAMPRPIHCFLALALAALLLAGCGNKGDLVLPDQQPKKAEEVAAHGAPAKAPDAKAGGAVIGWLADPPAH